MTDRASLAGAFAGVDLAYYLIHSMAALRAGDALDFWRVEVCEPATRLRPVCPFEQRPFA